MAKKWVITLEPTDKSAPKRVVEMINGRKKIAEVEVHLGKLYQELTAKENLKIDMPVTRISGSITRLEKAPYTFEAVLTEN